MRSEAGTRSICLFKIGEIIRGKGGTYPEVMGGTFLTEEAAKCVMKTTEHIYDALKNSACRFVNLHHLLDFVKLYIFLISFKSPYQ